ncbi:chemotaxis protein CheA [soil metagenome]
MRESDPELTRLLVLEIERHESALDVTERESSRRALHALKGSAALANEPELATELTFLERRLLASDLCAITDPRAFLATAKERLVRGERAVSAVWPEPPTNLVGGPLEPNLFSAYHSEVTDRLIAIDDILGDGTPAMEKRTLLHRHIHTIKGAASAIGDEPMAWFCHGLEESLRKYGDTPEEAFRTVDEVALHRTVLGALLDDPEAALALLRKTTRPRSTHPTSLSPETERVRGEDATVRVSFGALDRLLGRISAGTLDRDAMQGSATREASAAGRARSLRGELAEALRLIGPPRPWGAPAAAIHRIERVVGALGSMSDELEAAAGEIRRRDPVLREGIVAAKKEIAQMREAAIGTLLARVAAAVEAEARRTGREVIVRATGESETVDRRVLEQLAEPCLQIARNSVAHGIELPHEREAAGKPRAGTLTIDARKVGGRLRLSFTDDGAGVDVAAVRAHAIEIGAVGPELGAHADDDTLLALLFLPGFSTRKTSDLLAGRGVGLDIVLGAVQRLGGGVRLSSKLGQGLVTRIDLPIDRGVSRVVFLRCGRDEYALEATQIANVTINEGELAERTPHLASCLDRDVSASGAMRVELIAEEGAAVDRAIVAVDSVSHSEELLVPPITGLVSSLGPFAGAVQREGGALRLVLDGFALAPRARALARVHAGVPSERPRS